MDVTTINMVTVNESNRKPQETLKVELENHEPSLKETTSPHKPTL
jgi:hypothetical protein